MKIRNKILFCIMPVTLTMIFVCGFLILNLTKDQIKQEKLSLHSSIVERILQNFTYVSDDIEYYVFDSYTAEDIAKILHFDQYAPTRYFQINSKLGNMVANNAYVEEAVIYANDGNIYCDDNTKETGGLDRYNEIMESKLSNAPIDILWCRDEDGNVYFCRKIYNLNPYVCVGSIITRINTEYLGFMIGEKGLDTGIVSIFDRHGNEIISFGTDDVALKLKNQHNAKATSTGYSQIYQSKNQTYHIFTTTTDRQDWSIIHVVSEDVILQPYDQLTEITGVIGAVLVLFTVLISAFTARSITKNLSLLTEYAQRISEGDKELRIPNLSEDETGELAKSFNAMLDELEKSYDETMRETSQKQQIQLELAEFKYRSLQSQISPHLICNILSAISSLAIMGESEKVDSISTFSAKFLRNNIQRSTKKFTTIRSEIESLEQYLNVFQSIYSVPVEYTSHIDKNVDELLIPTMLLQPLVENSLKYGVSGADKKTLKIEVSAIKIADDIVLTVKDDGKGCGPEILTKLQNTLSERTCEPLDLSKDGFGIYGNLHRLKLLYGERANVRIESAVGCGFCITIKIPTV